MTQEPADRDVAGDRMAVEIQQGLGVEIPRDIVRDVEDAVVGVPVGASGIAQQLVLVGIAVRTNVGSEIAPGERREDQAEIRNDAAVP